MNSLPGTCNAVTKKGTTCKRPPMKGGELCYIHSFGNYKHITWWKHPLFHAMGVLVTILGVFLAIIFFILIPTRENQQRIRNNQRAAEGLRKKEHPEAMSMLNAIAEYMVEKPENPPVEEAKREIEKELRAVFQKQEKEALKFYNLGRSAYDNNQFKKGINHFEAALKIVKIPSFYLSLGNCYFVTSDFKMALTTYKTALKSYRIKKDRHGEGKALGGLGNVYRSIGQGAVN